MSRDEEPHGENLFTHYPSVFSGAVWRDGPNLNYIICCPQGLVVFNNGKAVPSGS